MNHQVPIWNITDLSPAADQKIIMGPDHEFMELLWQNGEMVLNKQMHRKPSCSSRDSKPVQKFAQQLKDCASVGILSNFIQEDQSATWLSYTFDDSREKGNGSEFFEMPSMGNSRMESMNKVTVSGAKDMQTASVEETHGSFTSHRQQSQPAFKQLGDTMPPQRLQIADSNVSSATSNSGQIKNFPHFSMPVSTIIGSSNQVHEKMEECLVAPNPLSNCDSGRVNNDANFSQVSSNGVSATEMFAATLKKDMVMTCSQKNGHKETLETTITSSSGWSGESGRMMKQCTRNQSGKRKERDADESECQSEETDYISVEANKPGQHSTTRRNRAAEVHNLSERRRRDRINEKMRALQELIPHCNKSDKASMLDEAIEYLKSLQLQLQMMWMGSSMPQMMYPSPNNYLSSMAMAMQHSLLPSIHGTMPLTRVPLMNHSLSPLIVNQTPFSPSQVLNQANLQNQVPTSSISDSYGHFLGIQPMYTASQATNLFMFGSETMPNAPKMASPTSNSSPGDIALPNNFENGNIG